MITEQGARQLAADLMAPYQKLGLANDVIVENAVKLIMTHVETDELRQRLAQMEVTKQ